MSEEQELKKSLGPVMLWGLGVGYVISGMYFGWNLGLPAGGTLGLAIATFFIAIMYITFTFSYTELACAIPKAGGAFDYSLRAFGPMGGLVAGIAQIIEFVFAPPAIAAAIGAYFSIYLPTVPVLAIAMGAYIVFTALNIYGVKAAATFELIITVFAVFELLLFAGITLPHFQVENLTQNPLPNGYSGIFAAIPAAIWFFLAIEGVANVAEETVNPNRNVKLGFGSAILTLIILCILTFSSSIGVAGWEAIVYSSPGAEPSDSPLPLALSHIYSEKDFLYQLLVGIGLMGLVASFHGIVLAAGRATFEFGRQGFAPKFLGSVHSKFKTPANALIINMLVGFGALLSGKTGEIITIACFGALNLYIISMLALFKLRKIEPELERPFKTPLYPYFPMTALIIASIAFIAMAYFNFKLFGLYLVIVLISLIWFKFNRQVKN